MHIYRLFAFTTLSLAFALSAFSGETVTVKAAKTVKTPVELAPNFIWTSDSDFEAQAKEALALADRKVAANPVISQDLMSPEYREFRDRLLKTTDPQTLDKELAELDAKYDKLPPDLQFIAAQVIPLRSLRSLIYRLVPLVEKKNSVGLGTTKLAHSLLLTVVQQGIAAIRLYLPSQHATGGAFEYITTPVSSADTQFHSIAEFQDFIGNTSRKDSYYSALSRAATRLYRMKLSTRVIWDNQLIFGAGTLDIAEDRFRLMGEPERHIALSMMNGAMESVALFGVYKLEDILPMTQRLGEQFGFDTILKSVDGVPADQRAAVFRDPKYADTFIMARGGQDKATLSLYHLQESLKQAIIARNELQKRAPDAWAVFDPAGLVPWQRMLENVDTFYKISKGPTEVKSTVTYKTVTVDLAGFMNNMPNDLRVLLPTSFEKGGKTRTAHLEDGKTLEYRNYSRGRPIEWSLTSPGYKNLFPNETSAGGLIDDVRAMSLSFGGSIVGMPISAFFQ